MSKKGTTSKRFIPSISYKEHRRRAKEIFENEVIPQMKVTNLDENQELTPAQKAHVDVVSKK